MGDRYWQNVYLGEADDITLRLGGRSSLTLPSLSSLIPASFVCGRPLVWDRAVGKTHEVLERGQLLCAMGAAEAKGDEVEVFSSPCQSHFKVLSGI